MNRLHSLDVRESGMKTHNKNKDTVFSLNYSSARNPETCTSLGVLERQGKDSPDGPTEANPSPDWKPPPSSGEKEAKAVMASDSAFPCSAFEPPAYQSALWGYLLGRRRYLNVECTFSGSATLFFFMTQWILLSDLVVMIVLPVFFKLKSSWHKQSYSLQVTVIVIQYLYTFQNGHRNKSGYRLSPYDNNIDCIP